MKFCKAYLRLYGITPDYGIHDRERLLWQVEASLKGGITMLQLRDKTSGDRELTETALALRDLCRAYDVPFIMNDRVDIARIVDADGVHVGQEDMELSRARKLLGPDKIIGVTAKTVEQALAAQAGGADYLGSGAMFPSGSKKEAKAMSRETLRSICASVQIPVTAIGGITVENASQLSGCGIEGIAVIQGIYGQPDIQDACRKLRSITEKIC